MEQAETKTEERMLEEQHLQKVIEIADCQTKEAFETIERQKEEMLEAKKEVRENTTYGLSDLYDNDEFEALVEMKQCMDHVSKLIRDYDEESRKLARLESVKKRPYFGRIDFTFEDGVTEEIYIGRIPLSEKKSREIYIYDWRSPIAGVFYRFMTGKAYYDAPAGRIEGELRRKRQYEIEDGKLQFFFDTDRNISDEILRQMLSGNTSPKMKAIVETIQREQDMVIRDMESDLLMVQGVAGSGKTSIALHRAAFLMYQGLQSRLSANNILILSPNAAFEEYISDVLPELGEENVMTAVFEDILREQISDKQIQSHFDYLENTFRYGRKQTIAAKSMNFKSSAYFLDILDYFLEELPKRWMSFRDISVAGKGVIEAKKLKNRLLRRAEVPLGIRLEQLQTYAVETLFGTGRNREDWEGREQVRQELQEMAGLNPVDLYRRLFRNRDFLEEMMMATEYVDDLDELCEYTSEHLENGPMLYEDAVAVCYLSLRVYGTDEYRHIKQVVIDEAQDYGPIHYEIFRMLYPNAKFTVLGDVNQTLAKQEDMSMYKEIKSRLGKKSSALVVLDKSFRCTNEILNFSLQFIGKRPEITNFNRSGETPKIVEGSTGEKLLTEILRAVEESLDCGLKSVCLLCKTEEYAKNLYRTLKDHIKLHLFTGDSTERVRGVLVMPVYLSKGLEFDSVIICDADKENYYDEEDRKLLYVECTRALHRLWVMCPGKKSPLIQQNPSDSESYAK